MKPTKQQFQSTRYRSIQIKQLLFLGFLLLGGLLGLILPRPEKSDLEKRALEKFPALTLDGMMDGSFFSGVDKWYSDTYPLREDMTTLYFDLQYRYGDRTEQIIGSQDADEIPAGTVDLAALAGKSTTEATKPPAHTEPNRPVDPNGGGTLIGTEPSAPETTEFNGHGPGDVDGEATYVNSVCIIDGVGYGLYYFNESNSARYCLMVNQLAENLAGKAQLYSVLCPVSSGVMLSEEMQKKVNCSDEAKAAEWLYRNMDPSVKTVPIVNALRAHNDEYLYFRTDHHWTTLGAYYAYREWCKVKGVTPHELSFFEKTMTFEGFLGTFYSDSNRDPSLEKNEDTVVAYVPNGTNNMTMYTDYNSDKYNEYGWRIINDVSDYPKGGLYDTFVGGDPPYAHAHNEEITDGSSVLVVKDSYANAFIPFLVDHYEHIYWIDFRYYKKWCEQQGYPATITSLVEREGIQDVILCQNIVFTSSDASLSIMEKFFK